VQLLVVATCGQNKHIMKEKIFDVLIYLFENYMEDEMDRLPDNDAIRTELMEVGFEQLEVVNAFDWLESLTAHVVMTSTSPTFRIFSEQEQRKLDLECRNLLLFLEHTGILTPANRELTIDRAMALADQDITLDELKWIVLMVLLSRADDAVAFSRMEDLVYDLTPAYLH
jgi:Smg protein